MRAGSQVAHAALAIFLLISGAIALYPRAAVAPLPVPPPSRVLAPATPDSTTFGWRLVRAMSDQRAIVLEVETTRPDEALMVAQQLTTIYTDRCDEVLVYFYEPDARPRLATIRVQWTRAHGYRTLVLRPFP